MEKEWRDANDGHCACFDVRAEGKNHCNCPRLEDRPRQGERAMGTLSAGSRDCSWLERSSESRMSAAGVQSSLGAVLGAGVDWLPLHAFNEMGVKLTTVSGVHAFPISETVFAMILSLTRKVHSSIRRQMAKQWENPGSLGEIHGKTLGIIGVGAIGEEIVRLAKAFNMRVVGVRRSGEDAPNVDEMYDLHGLHEVLAVSDYVVVTLPLTNETRHLFGRAEFECMKPTAYFVNVGRGERPIRRRFGCS